MDIRSVKFDSDFPRIVDLINQVEPEPVTLAQLQQWTQRLPPGRVYRQMVATDGQELAIGYSEAIHETWSPADHFYVWVVVDQPRRRRGVGAALYAEVQEFLLAQGAASLASEVRDNDPDALRFAEQRGFSVDRHHFESRLDLTTIDETPYQPAIAALEAAGMRFFSLADLNDSQEARLRLYELNRVTALDIPGSKVAFRTFAEFEQTVFHSEWYRPEGQLVVADGETWAGLSAVRLMPQTRGAYNLMTGVLRAYRGRKIAQALKLKAICYAHQHGARYILTHNDSLNAPILAINQKLGYQPKPGKYILKGSATIEKG